MKAMATIGVGKLSSLKACGEATGPRIAARDLARQPLWCSPMVQMAQNALGNFNIAQHCLETRAN